MFAFITRRLVHAVVVLWGVSTIVFLLAHLSGDPTDLLLPPDATVQQRAEFRHALGYDRPLPVQYGEFIRRAAHLDFGTSVRYQQPALPLVLERVGATLELAGVGLLIALAVSLPLGVLAAVRRGGLLDSLSLTVALSGQSLPVFWVGIMLILVFSERLHWLPSGGRGGWQNLVMPGITLSLLTIATVTRILRSSLLEVLAKDFMRTARAKGLRERTVLFRHGLRNALIPVLTIFGLSVGGMLGGAVVTETVFAWPGMGRLAVQAIGGRDFAVIQAFVFFTGVVIVAINTVVDVLYAVIDPRVRLT